jgi:hypothetical protein
MATIQGFYDTEGICAVKLLQWPDKLLPMRLLQLYLQLLHRLRKLYPTP